MQREKAYLDVMEKHGMQPRIVNEVIMHGEERETVDKFFSDYPDVDGIFAAGYTMAQTAYGAAREKGYSVPDDLQIIGYDGSFKKWGFTQLTAVEQPIAEMAEKVVELLYGVIEGKSVPARTALGAKLVVGATTK